MDQTNTTLSPIMQWVAKHHAAPTVNLTANTAGVNAIKEAMQCIWGEDLITLSSVFVNQKFSTFRVHSTTLRKKNSSGGTVASFSFNALVDANCGSYSKQLRFKDKYSAAGAFLGVSGYGSYDWSHDAQADSYMDRECVPNGESGYCGEYAPPSDGTDDICVPDQEGDCICLWGEPNAACRSTGSRPMQMSTNSVFEFLEE